MSDTTKVHLTGGPLDGYDHQAETVDEAIPLRFNGKPDWTQHVYHLDGNATDGTPVYAYKGDDTSNVQPLTHRGIDVPDHAFRSRSS